MPDVLHIAVPTKDRREGSAALNIPGTGTQFLDAKVVERPLVTISGVLDDRLDDSDQRIIINQPIDAVTNAIEIIDYPHHDVHEGNHYTFSTGVADLDASASLDYIFTIPDTTKWPHMVLEVIGSLATRFEIFEDTTHTTGVRYSIFNNNRNSANKEGIIISASSGDNSDGICIFGISFGVDAGGGANLRSGGGESRGDSEWILKQNAKYLARVTSLTNNNSASLVASWYEHTNTN